MKDSGFKVQDPGYEFRILDRNLRVGLIVILNWDMIDRIHWIYSFLGFQPVPLKSGDETEKYPSCFPQELRAKEAGGIVADRS